MKYLGRKIFLKDGGSHWCQQLVLDFYNCHCCVFWCQQWVYLGKWIECSIMSINSILGGCSCHDVTRWFAKSCYKASRSGCLMSPSWNWISGMDPTESTCVKCFSWRQLDFLVHEDISSLISGASSALKPDRGSQVFNSLGRGGTTCASCWHSLISGHHAAACYSNQFIYMLDLFLKRWISLSSVDLLANQKHNMIHAVSK